MEQGRRACTRRHLSILKKNTIKYYNCISTLLTKNLEKAMAPHSSTLAWGIPWMEEPGRLQSMESLRVRHR